MNASSVGVNARTGSPLAWAAFTRSWGGAFAAGSGERDTSAAPTAASGTSSDLGNPRNIDFGGRTGRRIPPNPIISEVRNPIDTLFQAVRQLQPIPKCTQRGRVRAEIHLWSGFCPIRGQRTQPCISKLCGPLYLCPLSPFVPGDNELPPRSGRRHVSHIRPPTRDIASEPYGFAGLPEPRRDRITMRRL